MLRVVVAVVLAAALVATSLPAIETARRDRSMSRMQADLDGLETAIDDLRAREQASPPNSPGARRVVTIRIPSRGWTHAGVDYLAIGGRLNGTDRNEQAQNETAFAWQVSGSQERVRRLPGVHIEHGTTDDDTPLVLRESGTHRLAIQLTERHGQRVVVISRLD